LPFHCDEQYAKEIKKRKIKKKGNIGYERQKCPERKSMWEGEEREVSWW
jgi:hypothetical protein